MKQKEKAKELVDRFMDADYTDISIHGAKQCALITCEELWEECADDKDKYWEGVKSEIEKLQYITVDELCRNTGAVYWYKVKKEIDKIAEKAQNRII